MFFTITALPGIPIFCPGDDLVSIILDVLLPAWFRHRRTSAGLRMRQRRDRSLQYGWRGGRVLSLPENLEASVSEMLRPKGTDLFR